MQFDHIQNHDAHILYLAECLVECEEDDDLRTAEQAIHALHQFMTECALRGRYATVSPVIEKIDAIISQADSAAFVQLLAENFPVSLARVYDLMRLHKSEEVRRTLIENITTHQAVAFDPKDSVCSQSISLGKLLIKQGDASSLCSLMSEVLKYNPDAIASLIIWAIRAAPEALYDPVLAWFANNDRQGQVMSLVAHHFGSQLRFRELVDLKAAGIALAFSDFPKSQAEGVDYSYYDFKLKRSVQVSMQELFSPRGAALDAKVSYCLLRNFHMGALLEIAARPDMQQALRPMFDALILAIDSGYIREDQGLRGRVGAFLDACLADQPAKVAVEIAKRYPRPWLAESTVCMTTVLEVELGL